MNDLEISEFKKNIRKKFKTKRRLVDNPTQLAAMLQKKFFDTVVLCKRYIIASYIPINHEINVLPLTVALYNMGHTIAIPVIVNKDLAFHNWLPVADAENSTLIPKLILTPLIAFDLRLARIGYGGGFYDRLIAARTPEQVFIGIAYEQQLCHFDLPTNDYDKKVDLVITDCNVYGLPNGSRFYI